MGVTVMFEFKLGPVLFLMFLNFISHRIWNLNCEIGYHLKTKPKKCIRKYIFLLKHIELDSFKCPLLESFVESNCRLYEG